MTFLILAVGALALCQVIIAAVLIAGMTIICDCRKDQKNTDDMISILAGSIAENKADIKKIKNKVEPKTTIIHESNAYCNYNCDSCIYAPPSELDGKPCCACDPDNPIMNCYQPKEDESV